LIKCLDLKITENANVPSSPIPRKPKPVIHTNGHGSSNGNSNGNGATMNGHKAPGKRSADEALGDGPPSGKKAKLSSNGSHEVILIEDTDGAIMIDD
jgi:hypothetical protein